jgi:cysteine synthase
MNEASVLQCIHNTPLVKLSALSERFNRSIYVKLEGSNPTGSMKDRVALNCISRAEERGDLKRNGGIVVSSSGNMALSAAFVGRKKGYKVTCVLEPKVTAVNLSLIKRLKAETVMVQDADPTGNYLMSRIQRVNEIVDSNLGIWHPDQYNNDDHPKTHFLYTAPEILRDLHGQIGWLVCTAGTGGSLGGLSRFFKLNAPKCKVMAVDAKGSVVLGGPPGPRLQVGHGSSRNSNFIDSL